MSTLLEEGGGWLEEEPVQAAYAERRGHHHFCEEVRAGERRHSILHTF